MNKPRAYTKDEWEEKRDVFTKLYLSDLTLAKVREKMSQEHDFRPTEASCKKKVKAWDLKKNIDAGTALGILKIEDRRRNEVGGKDTEFIVRKRPLDEKKMENLRKRRIKEFDLKNSDQSLTDHTPPSVQYHTPNPAPEESQENPSVHMVDDHCPSKDETPVTTRINEENCNQGPLPEDISSLLNGRISELGITKSLMNGPPGTNLEKIRESEESFYSYITPWLPLPPECIKVRSSSDAGSAFNVTPTGACWVSPSGRSDIGGWIRDHYRVVMSGKSPFNMDSTSTSYSFSTAGQVDNDGYQRKRETRAPPEIISIDLDLHHAVVIGDESAVRSLLDKGTDLTEHGITRGRGRAILRLAMEKGNENVVQLLLEKGADPTATTKTGETTLQWAAGGGHEKVVQLLLEKGVDPTVTTKTGETTLQWAAEGGHEKVVQLLLEEGVDPTAARRDGETALHQAAKGGHEKVVQLLLEKGVDPTATGWDGETALRLAVKGGHEKVVQLLLEKGVDPTATTWYGEMALHRAAGGGHEKIVQLLLEKGVDPTATTLFGDTALHRAAEGGHEKVVQLLLEKGADPTPTTKTRGTALHRAAQGGHEKVVQLLLEKGADPTATKSNGVTALHWAAKGGHEKVVQLLLEKGADPTATTQYGKTALHRAAEGGHEKVVQLLLEKGVDPAATT